MLENINVEATKGTIISVAIDQVFGILVVLSIMFIMPIWIKAICAAGMLASVCLKMVILYNMIVDYRKRLILDLDFKEFLSQLVEEDSNIHGQEYEE